MKLRKFLELLFIFILSFIIFIISSVFITFDLQYLNLTNWEPGFRFMALLFSTSVTLLSN